MERFPGGQGLKKALKEFSVALEHGEHPRRVYKPSGVDRRGNRFEPCIRLNLWHHHLGCSSEPLLILQVIGLEVFSFALSTHALHFQGDKMLSLHDHMEGLDWSDCEGLKHQVAAHRP